MPDLTNPLTERVATAIWESWGDVPFDKVKPLVRAKFIGFAEAAIKALSSEQLIEAAKKLEALSQSKIGEKEK